jgi:putative (di)nucleoside polyphosphate hydrolase
VVPSQYFRAGAGALIVNDEGMVLALERSDVAGVWQLPQGGLDRFEEPADAALREASEETGIPGSALELLQACPEPLAYELPLAMRSERTGRGQVQYWFLFRFRGTDALLDVASGAEFRSWKWMRFGRLIELVADFRKPVYRHLARHFQAHLPERDPERPASS